MTSALTYCSKDPSSNHAGYLMFLFIVFLFEKTKLKENAGDIFTEIPVHRNRGDPQKLGRFQFQKILQAIFENFKFFPIERPSLGL